MKLSTPSLLACALLAGAAAGGLTASLLNDSPIEVDAAAPSRGVPSEVGDQLKALGRDNRALRSRVDMLAAKLAGSDRSPVEGYLTRADLEELLESLQRPDASPLKPAGVEFKDTVADALADVRREEAAARAIQRGEKAIAQLDGRTAKMTDWLGLDPGQSERMREILEAQLARDIELAQQWESGVDPELLGQTKQSNADAFRGDMQGLLTADQWETYSSRGKE
ncbi:MAG: hypothetical protein O2816_06260 [Planctomycetota bacterium]|nr:hypothetical protein [Planctomycetota bacterium]